MPKLTLSKSINIEKPVQEVYTFLNNMSNWHIWSPWLITDENAKPSHSEDNQEYYWEGKRVGSGQMKITDSKANTNIHFDLQIFKPWKSNSKISMSFKEDNGGTELIWSMEGNLPIFLFWLKKTMTALIGNDYDRGLRMLKDYLEKGKIESKLSHIGPQAFDGCKFIGIKRTCSIDDIGTLMEKDFTKLMAYAKDNPNLNPEKAFSMYHKWDMKNHKAEYTAGIPYEGEQPDIPEVNTTGEIPSLTVYTLQHTGRYDHIGNAWSTLYTMVQNKELKLNKKIAPFETYGNSPKDTQPADLIAYINFPIKI